jgi:hypothetical protein
MIMNKDSKQPATVDTPAFREALRKYRRDELYEGELFFALVAHIDAHTAATRMPAVPKRLMPKEISEQIARDAIDGAILKGRMNISPPPSPEHWLNEYWQIGRQLAEYGKTGADNVNPADDAAPLPAQAQPVADALKAKIKALVEAVASHDGAAAVKARNELEEAMLAAQPSPAQGEDWRAIAEGHALNAAELQQKLDALKAAQGDALSHEQAQIKQAYVSYAQGRAAGIEEAAKVCENIAQDHWDQYKGRGKHAPNNPRRADPHADGCSDGANQCADDIRVLAAKPVEDI